MPPIQVLLIEGMSITGSNMKSDSLLNSAPTLQPPHVNTVRIDFGYGENAPAVKEMIQSKLWNAIIISDLSHEHNAFASALGDILREYTFHGGRLAFTSSDGQNLIPIFKELFDVPWRRQTKSEEIISFSKAPMAEPNIAEVFGQDADDIVRKVRDNHTMHSSTFSNVPRSDAVFVSQDVGDFDEEWANEHECPDFVRAAFTRMGDQLRKGEQPVNNVLVAVRRHGKGVISYYGDEECIGPIAQLVAVFCTRPRAGDGNDNADERFKLGMEAKEEGNTKFKDGKIEVALSFYEVAERHMRPIKEACKSEYAKVLGNIAESCLKLQRWQPAIEAVTAAIEIDGNSVKALYRRARAYIQAATADATLLYMYDDYWGSPQDYLKKLTKALEKQLSLSRSMPTHDEPEDRERQSRRSMQFTENETEATDPLSSLLQQMGGEIPNSPDRPNWSWSVGLGAGKQYEWLVDCYRMRVDDEYAVSEKIRSKSLYDPDHTEDSILVDFLVFSKLAVLMEAVPPSGWDWARYMSKARQLLRYAFEKDDAFEKYGGENFFEGAVGIGSGRSLRFTAQQIFAAEVTTLEVTDFRAMQLESEVVSRCFGDDEYFDEDDVVDFDSAADVFEDVGGVQLWRDLKHALRGV